MKKIIILTACLAVITALNASAKIWRVNNAGLPADFTTIQAAHDASTVLAGDTLHIEPSTFSYGSLTLTKKLIILGPGYYLDKNPNQQANPATATIGRLMLNEGSGGSIISGLTITHPDAHIINTGNITVSRNNFADSHIYLSANTGYSNVIISGNYDINNILSEGSSTNLITNVFILNNEIYTIKLNNQFSGVFANNIIHAWGNALYNFTIKNNICDSNGSLPVFGGSFNTISYNICRYTAGLPVGDGNQNGVDMTTVFVGPTGNSPDGQWQLKEDSPAIRAGLSGEDCGMYGGTTPYHLSGLPKIPSVYFLSAPATSNGPSLSVTISVKANN